MTAISPGMAELIWGVLALVGWAVLAAILVLSGQVKWTETPVHVLQVRN